MTSFLAGSLANAIAAGFNGKLLSGTLRKVTTTGRASNGDPVTSTADYAVQGLQDNYSAFFRANAGIPDDDLQILLIARLCGAAPAIGDRININGGWFQVRKVGFDPAGATFDCQCFSIPG
ncbi:hypothetical protein EN788_22230 [Mesorhizobium sp. M2D.F.Ca.ET.145.01.1.1]|uniref:hypothetical protein n=1 Tax=unclassified Mesorhizobium TaxID=325217 RepID=UPI000FCA8A7B|nr:MULTISPECIES: hypothetical protein [unclassified Mesorhizobium]TGU44637.1 hypothetical protein EN789_21780 [bacterium M00.F.Ca.ET.146.01.1.1]TGU58465.1 hypothetical protein EN791_021780 [Mesorhizobium sp. M2D.F.Ca.ET.148.01.1.1]TGU64397.1 hypothetical protein EN790_21775 [Mesorhizobium sp. M2D.F.Ca.ET.147.01.1.1]TGW09973.1 hypothetical protein EN788_22230 [Mesorhizobium sp. M2D.F.Ca.ET.145.01.1.1]